MAPRLPDRNRSARCLMLAALISSSGVSPLVAQRLRPLVGATIGYSSAALVGSDQIGTRHVAGAVTGPFVDIPFGDVVSLRPQLLFNVKGGAIPPASGAVAGEVRVELGYLELPVLIVVHPRLTRAGLRLLLIAGGGVAYRIGCSLESTVPGAPTLSSCDEVKTIRRLDFLVAGGGGVEFRRRDTMLSLGVRITQGLRRVVDGADLRNQTIDILLGFSM
jgi:hypothetical protein